MFSFIFRMMFAMGMETLGMVALGMVALGMVVVGMMAFSTELLLNIT